MATATLTGTDPTLDPDVRRRLQARLAQPAADPTAPTAPTAPTTSAAPFAAPVQATATTTDPARGTLAGNERGKLVGGGVVDSTGNLVAPETQNQPTVQYQPAGATETGQAGTTASTTAPTAGTSTDPDAFGRAWLASGGRTLADFKAFVAAHPEFAVTLGGSKGDKATIGGRTFDAVIAAGEGGRGASWNEILPGGTGGGAVGSSSNPFLDQLRALLMARIQGDLGPVDPNAPAIAEPYTAARLAAQRETASERRALAERLFASGGGNVDEAQLTQAIQQSAERNATGLADLRARLIANEYQARRADLDNALQQALASGDAQLARDIQAQIATLDAQLRREGYGVQLAIDQNNRNQNTATAAGG